MRFEIPLLRQVGRLGELALGRIGGLVRDAAIVQVGADYRLRGEEVHRRLKATMWRMSEYPGNAGDACLRVSFWQVAVMTTVEIALNDEHHDFLAEAVKSGRYDSESAVIAEALTEFREREAFLLSESDNLRAKIQVGAEQADRGDFVEFTAEDVKHDGRNHIFGQSAPR